MLDTRSVMFLMNKDRKIETHDTFFRIQEIDVNILNPMTKLLISPR